MIAIIISFVIGFVLCLFICCLYYGTMFYNMYTRQLMLLKEIDARDIQINILKKSTPVIETVFQNGYTPN